MQQKPLYISGKALLGRFGGYGDSARLGYTYLGKRDFGEYSTFARLVGRMGTWGTWKGVIYVLWRYPSTSMKLVGRKWTWGIQKEFVCFIRKNISHPRNLLEEWEHGAYGKNLQVYQEKQYHFQDWLTECGHRAYRKNVCFIRVTQHINQPC